MFAPLHTKSDCSPGYGTAPVGDLVKRAREYGYPAVALTDVENLYGHVRFHDAARRAGVRPIVGVELRPGYGPGTLGRKERRLVLLARDQSGYESLCRIITARRAVRARQSDDPLTCLALAPRGLFYMSDDVTMLRDLFTAGIARAELRFLYVRPEEIRPPEAFQAVADPDVVMLDPSDHELHVLQASIRCREKVFTLRSAEPPERSLPPPETLARLYGDAPETLKASLDVSEACRFRLDEKDPPIVLGVSGPETAEDRLERLTRERFAAGNDAGKWSGPPYRTRLDGELLVLRELELGGYFLAVTEITDRARRMGLMLGGRGSAGSSLVAHVLGVTPLDPLAYGLYFERFLHVRRSDRPDIDLDVPSSRRDALLDWVFRRFGVHRAAMVSAHQTFRTRAAYREGLRALGMSPVDIGRFAERMPPEELEDVLAFPDHLLTGRFREAIPLIERLIGKLQHLSVHPGGVVLAEPRLDRHVPLERAAKGVLVTQYDMHALKRLGLIKIDLLGNRALSAIQETLQLERGLQIKDEDPATLETLRTARTLGCFQIETPPMRSLLRKLPQRGIADLMIALAIVRPGPASGDAKAEFIRRARGEAPPDPVHPRLEEALAGTHGMMLYEEDLMVAIAALTGRSLEDADTLRAALAGAEGDETTTIELRRTFLSESIENGNEPESAKRVWETLRRFVAYSFNKAHAAGYAHIAWQTAFLKTHAPAAFAAAVLNHYGGVYPLRTLAADFQRQGVSFLSPHVNASSLSTTLEYGSVRIGLRAVKHLTRGSREAIIEHRPFRNVRDLLERVPLRGRELEALVLSGACDDLAPLPRQSYPIAHERLLSEFSRSRDPRIVDRLEPRFPGGERGPLYAALVRVRNELTYLDMFLSNHPMRLLRDEAARAGCLTIEDAVLARASEVRISGIVATARRLETHGGHLMQFVTFEDETGLLEAVLLPGTCRSLGDPVTRPGPFLVTGRLVEDRGDMHLRVLDVIPFHERPRPFQAVS